MNRRSFIKRGALFVPAIFIPRLLRADNVTNIFAGQAMTNGTPVTTIPSSGGGGGDTILVLTQDTAGTLRNDFIGELGFQFTVGSSPITVTALARWVIAGNTGTHPLLITSGDCSSTITTVNVNTNTGTPGSYLWGTVSPVVLAANTAYRLVSTETTAGTEQWYNNGPITTTGVVGSISACYHNAGVGCQNAAANESFIPVNLKYHL